MALDGFDLACTFFPSNYGIEIGLESQNIACFEVFGTSDSKKINTYNNFAQKGADKYVITKAESSFPSELEFKGSDILQHGGLILVKLSSKQKQPFFKAKVHVSYEDPLHPGQRASKSYDVSYGLPGDQFYSEECLESALRAYYFVSEMKEVIRRINDDESRKGKGAKEGFVQAMQGLKTLAPEGKAPEVDKMIKIVEKYNFSSGKVVDLM